MANLKELKKRIKSTKNTLKITSAMKLVSAAKLAKAQATIVGARPYSNTLDDTIKTISALSKDYTHNYLKENSENKQAHLLVISADKGLCGGFNSQLAKEIRKFLSETDLDVRVHWIGKKAKELIGSEVSNQGEHFGFKKLEPSYQEIREIAEGLAKDFENGEVGKVMVAYNVFHSAISFTPTVKQVLPMSVSEEEKETLRGEFPFDFKYDQDPAEIMDALVPEAYVNSIYTCLLDAQAAEHGSRMSSMDSAASNCKDMIRDLSITANKLRQAAITTELAEVVSGAESLKG